MRWPSFSAASLLLLLVLLVGLPPLAIASRPGMNATAKAKAMQGDLALQEHEASTINEPPPAREQPKGFEDVTELDDDDDDRSIDAEGEGSNEVGEASKMHQNAGPGGGHGAQKLFRKDGVSKKHAERSVLEARAWHGSSALGGAKEQDGEEDSAADSSALAGGGSAPSVIEVGESNGLGAEDEDKEEDEEEEEHEEDPPGGNRSFVEREDLGGKKVSCTSWTEKKICHDVCVTCKSPGKEPWMMYFNLNRAILGRSGCYAKEIHQYVPNGNLPMYMTAKLSGHLKFSDVIGSLCDINLAVGDLPTLRNLPGTSEGSEKQGKEKGDHRRKTSSPKKRCKLEEVKLQSNCLAV